MKWPSKQEQKNDWKKRLLLFKESHLLKGLSAKKAHADEIADIHHQEFTLPNSTKSK